MCNLFASGKGIRAGILRIKPTLQLDTGYESNVYLTYESGSPGDFFVSPFVELKIVLPFLTHSFSFGVNYSYINYFHEKKQSGSSYNFFGDLDMNFIGGLSFDIAEKYSYTEEPILGNYEVVSSRLPHNTNTLSPSIIYKIPSGAITSRFNFQWILDSFPTQPDYDRTMYKFNLGTVYRFLPKTGLYFDLNIINVGKKNNGGISSTKYGGEIGLKGLITPRLSATAGFGWKYGEYSDGSLENEPVIRLSLEERFSQIMKMSLSYLRMTNDSFISDFYVLNMVKLSLWRALTATIATDITLKWWLVDYSPSTQKDNNYNAKVSINYSPAVATWLSGTFSYVFSKRDSNVEAFRYTDHKIFLGVKLSW